MHYLVANLADQIGMRCIDVELERLVPHLRTNDNGNEISRKAPKRERDTYRGDGLLDVLGLLLDERLAFRVEKRDLTVRVARRAVLRE